MKIRRQTEKVGFSNLRGAAGHPDRRARAKVKVRRKENSIPEMDGGSESGHHKHARLCDKHRHVPNSPTLKPGVKKYFRIPNENHTQRRSATSNIYLF